MTDQPKPFDLDKLDRLYAEATPGEWRKSLFGNVFDEHGSKIADTSPATGGIGDDTSEANGSAIVAIHNAYPALSARLRDNDSVLDTVRSQFSAERERYLSMLKERDSLSAELEAVKRERDELLEKYEEIV